MALEKASKVEMIKAFGNLTLDTIVKNKYPAIGALERYYGVEKTEKVVSIILHDMSSSFKGILNADDVDELTAEITSGIYRNLSLEDIYLVCRNLKRSKLHGKLDQNKLLNAMDDHLNERIEKIRLTSLNDHLANKEPKAPRSGDSEKEAMREAKNWYLKEKNKSQNDN